ncbi:MAG: iron chelate uptake ABC transporter family permease subunit [Acidimicrobiales bacterium]
MPAPPSDHGVAPPRPPGGFVAVVAALGAVLLASMLLGISLGTVTVPLGEIRRVITAHLGLGDGEVSAVRDQIIWQYRTSRVVLAAVVGAALAVSGACLQVLARNGLADPYVLGVSSGASLGAVLAIAFGVTAVGGLGASGAAFVAAVLTLLVVFLLAQRAGRIGPSRLVLAGVATSYLASALTSLVQLYADPLALRGTMFWLLGSLQNAR